jgi:hypothetical protein
MTCGIYKLIFPNGKKYIGQSIDIEQRFRDHKKDANSCQKSETLRKRTKLRCAFKKYGWDLVVREIVENCVPEFLNDREVYFIAQYDSFNNGLNMTTGGHSDFQRSLETKQKLREINLGKRGGTQSMPFFVGDFRYLSILDASTKLGIPQKTIHNRLNSKNEKYADYIYEDVNRIPQRDRIHYGQHRIISVEINGAFYESASEASTKLGIPTTTLLRRARSISDKFSNYKIVENMIAPSSPSKSIQ